MIIGIDIRVHVPDLLWMIEREEMLTRVRAGESYDAIADSRGITKQRVSEIALEEGIRRKAPWISRGTRAQIVACLEAGDASYGEIADAFGVERWSVRDIDRKRRLKAASSNRKPRQLAELTSAVLP